MGSDQRVIEAARLCWDSFDKSTPESDNRLIKHLLIKEHKTPFEHVVFTFKIRCPIFVARQWMRHRIGSFCERSLRYCTSKREFYNPFTVGSVNYNEYKLMCNGSYESYLLFIDNEVNQETARMVLPLSIMTEFMWTVNLSSLMNFLKLRLDKSAQHEIREFAKHILEVVTEILPVTMKSFEQEILYK